MSQNYYFGSPSSSVFIYLPSEVDVAEVEVEFEYEGIMGIIKKFNRILKFLAPSPIKFIDNFLNYMLYNFYIIR